MATYKVYADVVVAVTVMVEAESEEQAIEICRDNVGMEAYMDATVGCEAWGCDEITKLDMDTLDDPRWDEAMAEEVF